MDASILDVRDIRKSYGRQLVLDDISIHVHEGSIAAVLGPNGAGKTTLVRILSTLTRPDAGNATVAGHDLLREPERVREQISLTGQYAAMDELLTGKENLLLAARLWHIEPRAGRERARDLLERFELVDAATRLVRTWSGGMKRKLDLAMSLMGEPRLLFLDEPTTGLDPRSRNALWDMIRTLKRSGVTVVLTTQYLEEADQLADHIIVIDHGRVIAEGSASELKRQVGRDIAVLTFPDPATAARARIALDGQASSESDLAVHVPTDGSADHLHDILARLRMSSIPAGTVDIRKPTLDDVFLALTSRHPVATEVLA